MKVITRAAEMAAERAAMKGRVGFVPTMGALHEGHLSLVRFARTESDRVVVSVFVNPAQFGPQEDFAAYPRDLDSDLRLLEAEGVDVVFPPTAEEIYPPGFDEWVEGSGPLTERLEGGVRPGHRGGAARPGDEQPQRLPLPGREAGRAGAAPRPGVGAPHG